MSDIHPHNLILRCYGHRTGEDRWYGVCLDLNLAAEADSDEHLKQKLNEMITSYIETVLDTEDKESIPELLMRRAPLKDWIIYYFVKALISIRNFPNNFTFKESVPFHLAHSC